MNLKERLVATRNQLEQIEYDYVKGSMTREMFLDRMRISMLKIKQEETLVKMAISKTKTRIEDLLGSITPEDEMLECPDQDGKFVTREMCLNYSGATKNNATCSSCKNYGVTRRLLLPQQ